VLTDLVIKKQPLPKKRREIPDGKIGGLYLIVQSSGAKSWAVRYRVDGAPRKLTIGPYPAVGPGYGPPTSAGGLSRPLKKSLARGIVM
jgi:hypothetical protein